MGFGPRVKDMERVAANLDASKAQARDGAFKLAGDTMRARIKERVDKYLADVNAKSTAVKAVEKELREFEAQKNLDLSNEINEIRERQKFKADLEGAIATVKKSIRLMSIISKVHAFKAQKYAENESPIEKELLRRKIEEKTRSVYARYSELRDDIKQAEAFVAAAIVELGKEREFTLQDMVIEREKLMPLLRKMMKHFQKAARTMVGKKEEHKVAKWFAGAA